VKKFLPGARLALTYAILFLVPGAMLKTGLLLTLWIAAFAPWKKSDAALFIGSSALFTVMNTASIHRGLFKFAAPNFLGLPYWEFFLWGFWVLHTHRIADGPPAPRPGRWEWSLVILFALSFVLFQSATAVLLASGAVLAAALARWHAADDGRHVAHMLLIGTLLEYPGVALGLWSYPDPPVGGVPPWYATMWGGIGLFLRRWAVPLATRLNGTPAP
jgi:hypothetical protein